MTDQNITVLLLRNGSEADFQGLIGELTYTTDTHSLLLRSSGNSPFKIPSDKTTGVFSYDPNLVFRGMNINEGRIDGTKIGETVRSSGGFTSIILNNGSEVTPINIFQLDGLNHGHTGFSGANVFGQFSVYNGSEGGLYIQGGSNSGQALVFEGTTSIESVSDDFSENSGGIVEFLASATSSGEKVDLNSSEVAFSFGVREPEGGVKRLLKITAEGNLLHKGTSGQSLFDVYDDIKLIEGIRGILSSDAEIKEELANSISYAKPILQEHKIIKDLEKGGIETNMLGIVLTVIDSIRQLNKKVEEGALKTSLLEERLGEIEAKIEYRLD